MLRQINLMALIIPWNVIHCILSISVIASLQVPLVLSSHLPANLLSTIIIFLLETPEYNCWWLHRHGCGVNHWEVDNLSAWFMLLYESSPPSLIHVRILTGLILSKPCACNHSCCEFMRAILIPCSEVRVSLLSSSASFYSSLFFCDDSWALERRC